MEWSEKIDSKKYLLGTFIGLVAAAVVVWGKWSEVLVLWTVTLVSTVNQWLLFRVLSGAMRRMMQSEQVTKEWRQPVIMVGQIVLKLGLLAAVFYFVVGHARHIVLYALVLFTFQLIILVLSIKNKGDYPK